LAPLAIYKKGAATGISGYVDVNIFNGTKTEIQSMALAHGAYAD